MSMDFLLHMVQLNVSSTSISISAKCLMITAREPGPNEERCALSINNSVTTGVKKLV